MIMLRILHFLSLLPDSISQHSRVLTAAKSRWVRDLKLNT